MTSDLTATMLVTALTVEEWRRRPSVTTLESVAVPVQELPFPTITVCQQKKEVT